jgi:hypothetical protein
VREFLVAAASLLSPVADLAPASAKSLTGDADQDSEQKLDPAQLHIGGATIEISFGLGGFNLPREVILAWVANAARAVTQYYGTFPVPVTRVRILPSERKSGAFSGETWGSDPPFTRIFVGRNTTKQQLDEDWLMTHELVHTAFPDVADEHHWIEEGIATYVEPIARAQIGDLTAEAVWAGMLDGMPRGEPQAFDQGLDHTHTWGRTYWGGALFCLVADVRIRRSTSNSRGLQDALRGIRQAGGTIVHHWPVAQAFEVGDKATGTDVLSNLYSEMKDKPVYVDLSMLWHELGVSSSNGIVSLSDVAELAQIRRSITAPQSR